MFIVISGFLDEYYDSSDSFFLLGVIIVPSAGVGIVLGGYIIKKLKLGARESAKLAMICSGCLFCASPRSSSWAVRA